MDKEDNIRSIHNCESKEKSEKKIKEQKSAKLLYKILNDINKLIEDKI